jgi:UDP:flavonoid glycosyltransferase YjiC (YdhE family)
MLVNDQVDKPVHIPESIPAGVPDRLTLLAIGSLGDIRPMLAFGTRLKKAGYRVTVASHDLFKQDIAALGLDFRSIAVNPRDVLESDAGRAWLRSQANPVKSALAAAALLRPVFRSLLDDSWRACRDAEVLICSGLALWGHDIATSIGIPYAFAPIYPMRRTRFIPAPGAAPLPLGGGYNLLTHLLFQQLNWQPFRAIANDWRTSDLGLPPAPAWAGQRMMGWPGVPVLYGYSDAVIPRPRDWPASQQVTGYWFLDEPPEQAKPDPGLAGFLDAGPPPLYIGFGSMTDPEPERLAAIVAKSLRLTRQRAVLLSGWARLPDPGSDQVIVVDRVSHQWLFPRIAAAVHHGGAGTTAAALRAGIPSVIVPYFLDQTLWGHRVSKLKAGPSAIPRQRLTAERLAAAIGEAVNDPGQRDRAQAIGRRIRAQDGTGTALRILNGYLPAAIRQRKART